MPKRPNQLDANTNISSDSRVDGIAGRHFASYDQTHAGYQGTGGPKTDDPTDTKDFYRDNEPAASGEFWNTIAPQAPGIGQQPTPMRPNYMNPNEYHSEKPSKPDDKFFEKQCKYIDISPDLPARGREMQDFDYGDGYQFEVNQFAVNDPSQLNSNYANSMRASDPVRKPKVDRFPQGDYADRLHGDKSIINSDETGEYEQ